MKNFWQELPRPFLVLAPLANVTDAAFRQIIAKYSKPSGPNVMYTEFVSADGLVLASEEGKAKLMRDLIFTEVQRPIVAQFFTARPEMMEKAAALAAELGFDGVDINMGCPDKSIEGQGAGAKLILTPERAVALVAAAKRGAPHLPISVKTRLGYNKDILEEWLPLLLETKPAVVTIHARTRKEMSNVPARWERIKRAVEIRNEMQKDLPGIERTYVIGNGDVRDIEDAKIKAEESGADAIMLGRAIFGRPWLFAQESPSLLSERLRIAVEHAELFESLLGDIKNFAIMKKHFKAYAEGFPGAKELRMKLMETNSAREVKEVMETFILEQ
jgi:nifR3 family TIM-barrel protein